MTPSVWTWPTPSWCSPRMKLATCWRSVWAGKEILNPGAQSGRTSRSHSGPGTPNLPSLCCKYGGFAWKLEKRRRSKFKWRGRVVTAYVPLCRNGFHYTGRTMLIMLFFLCCPRFTFCAQDPSKTEISPGDSITFVKCRDGWEVKPRKRYETQRDVAKLCKIIMHKTPDSRTICMKVCVRFTVFDQQAAHVTTQHFSNQCTVTSGDPTWNSEEPCLLFIWALSVGRGLISPRCGGASGFRLGKVPEVASWNVDPGLCPAYEAAGKRLAGWKRRQSWIQDYMEELQNVPLCGLVK